ncbi:8748_t:CDS:1, partial [Funneliformis geosporum]
VYEDCTKVIIKANIYLENIYENSSLIITPTQIKMDLQSIKIMRTKKYIEDISDDICARKQVMQEK